MKQEEFAKKLASWKRELTEEIMPYYKQGEEERGHQAFGRWKDRFSRFLQKYTPEEAERFNIATQHIGGLLAKRGEHPFQKFMREDGRTCIAFIDELEDSARKGRIIDFRKSGDAQLGTEKSAESLGMQSYYVDNTRIEELRKLKSSKFDLCKLLRLCEELNICYAKECFFSVAMLARAICDHVPPIFDCRSFSEFANNYKSGDKSFKECMLYLENSSRKIADSYLHGQIRKTESLSNKTQVNFSSNLDALLAEVIRVLK